MMQMTQGTFRLGAVHIEETVAYDSGAGSAQQRLKDIQGAVAAIDPSMPFNSVLLEDVLDSDVESGASSLDRRHQMRELLTVSAQALHTLCIRDYKMSRILLGCQTNN